MKLPAINKKCLCSAVQCSAAQSCQTDFRSVLSTSSTHGTQLQRSIPSLEGGQMSKCLQRGMCLLMHYLRARFFCKRFKV